MMNVGTNEREHPNSSPTSSPSPRQHATPMINDHCGRQVRVNQERSVCELVLVGNDFFGLQVLVRLI